MMAKILILNGSPRKNGATASLMNALIEGAKENGNEIKEDYITSMNIKDCIGCDSREGRRLALRSLGRFEKHSVRQGLHGVSCHR